MLIFRPGLLNHQGEVQNDRQPSRLVPTTATGQFFCLHSYLLYSLLREEAGRCRRGQLNEAAGEMKGGRSECGISDMKEIPPIWPLCSVMLW